MNGPFVIALAGFLAWLSGIVIFPIITIVGMNFAFLLSGVVIIEMVFALPGIGSLLINSVSRRDYHVIQGVLLFVAAANVLMNLLVDLAYVVIDKRVRYAG